jgi:hypothetical protein
MLRAAIVVLGLFLAGCASTGTTISATAKSAGERECKFSDSYGAKNCTTGKLKTKLVGGYYKSDGEYVEPHYVSE